MPQYDFRCDACARRFSLSFKTYESYDSASPRCPECDSAKLTRLISRVAIANSNRNYRSMSSQEMLSVLESGETKRVDEMFRQVSGGERADGKAPADPSNSPTA